MNIATLLPLGGVVAVLGLALALTAQAAPPLNTEDAAVLSARSCELDVSAQRAQPSTAGPVWATELACGLGLGSQLALGAAGVASQGGRHAEAAITGKTSLWQDGEAGSGLALAWQHSVARESGAASERSSSVKLVVSGALDERLSLHANMGWARTAGSNLRTWNLAAALPLGGGIDVTAEVFGNNRDAATRAVGLSWQAVDRLSIYGACSLLHDTPRVRSFTIGSVLAF